ncbi:hypothetical protein [Streptomyces sp. ODS28]|uniref:hypothetical protein n=1 Tax=Streptomyces sp. ODS28 TaxID=3136688 RepID=UPI0031EE8CBD
MASGALGGTGGTGGSSGTGRTGVCVVRIEAQTHGVLITLSLAADIEADAPGVKTSTADTETAVRLVREFLMSFPESGSDP